MYSLKSIIIIRTVTFSDVTQLPVTETEQLNRIDLPDNIQFNNQQMGSQITIEGLSTDTKIIDLEFSQFGALIGIQNSLPTIPYQCLNQIRLFLIDLLQKMMEFPNNLLHQKMFILTPTVLLTSLSPNISERVKEINNRLKCLKNDNWEQFTLSFFQTRKNINGESFISSENNGDDRMPVQHKEAIKQIKLGNLSKGMQKLNNNRIPISFNNQY